MLAAPVQAWQAWQAWQAVLNRECQETVYPVPTIDLDRDCWAVLPCSMLPDVFPNRSIVAGPLQAVCLSMLAQACHFADSDNPDLSPWDNN